MRGLGVTLCNMLVKHISPTLLKHILPSAPTSKGKKRVRRFLKEIRKAYFYMKKMQN